LTDRAVLPPDSKKLAYDPYEDQAANTRRYVAYAVVIAVLAWLAVAKVFNLWPF
jgi:hypothetical protein